MVINYVSVIKKKKKKKKDNIKVMKSLFNIYIYILIIHNLESKSWDLIFDEKIELTEIYRQSDFKFKKV